MQALFAATQQIRGDFLNVILCHDRVTKNPALHACIAMQVLSWGRAGKIGGMQSTPPLKAEPESRSAYRVMRPISTRWMDNDAYGHVNNVVYYSWFDTAVNAYLIEQGALDVNASDTIGLVVETQCNYFESRAFPQMVHVGLRVARLGNSSVRYEIGIFGESDLTAAKGHFVHVYVDKVTRRPVPLPPFLKQVLETLI